MRLMAAAEVRATERDRVFRHSAARALGIVAVSLAATGALIWTGRRQGSGLAWYGAAVILLGLVVMRGFILARFRPSNWLVRMTEDGLYLQVRSHLNHHFPPADLTVVFIPYGEIRSARLVLERRTIATREAGRRMETLSEQRRRLVQLHIAGEAAPLERALAEEAGRLAPRASGRRGAIATRYGHYPVRMAAPGVVLIEWTVVPGTAAFLEALGEHVLVAPSAPVEKDFTHLATLGREEQKRHLRELAQTGRTIEAVRMARTLYALDLAQARDFVEELLRAPR